MDGSQSWQALLEHALGLWCLTYPSGGSSYTMFLFIFADWLAWGRRPAHKHCILFWPSGSAIKSHSRLTRDRAVWTSWVWGSGSSFFQPLWFSLPGFQQNCSVGNPVLGKQNVWFMKKKEGERSPFQFCPGLRHSDAEGKNDIIK